MRKSGWEKDFNKLLEAKNKEPFKWGSNDCCLFTADFIAAITGKDYADWARGAYTNAIGAKRLLDAFGGIGGVASSILDYNGFNSVSPKLSQRGDAVMIEVGGNQEAFGVNAGKYAIFAGKDGIERIPVSKIKKAWRIE